MLNRYVDQLAMELEIDTPVKEKEEVKLTINPKLTIILKELDPGFFFFAPIAPLPSLKKEELFTLAMEANFLGQGTGGAVLGIDEEEKFMTLTLSLPQEMDYSLFKDALSNFANYVDYWKKEIKRKESE